MYKRWRVYSTFFTGFCIGLAYAILISMPEMSSATVEDAFLEQWKVLILTFSGIFGGVIYTIVVNGHVEMPRYIENRGALFKAGLFGDILLGIAGAFILNLLLPPKVLNLDLTREEGAVSGTVLAAIGIVGGYGGRAIIKFALERLFKTAGNLYDVRDATLIQQRAQANAAPTATPSSQAASNQAQTSTDIFSPETAEVNESAEASDQALFLIDRLDGYIQAGLPESEWTQLVPQLQTASTADKKEILSALLDLSQMDLKQDPKSMALNLMETDSVEPEQGLTHQQMRRLVTAFESLVSSFKPADHDAYYQLGRLYQAVSPPVYDKALNALEQAIAHRGPLAIGQPWQYELNRAMVNIQSSLQRQMGLQPNQTLDQLSPDEKTTLLEAQLEASQQDAIFNDLLSIAKIYNLETILKAAETQKNPPIVLGWLRHNRTLLEDRQETRSLVPALSPILTRTPWTQASQDTQGPSSSGPSASSTIPDNPQNIRFPEIYSALGRCYDILDLDPFDLINTGKQTHVFDFYPGEAIATLDEGETVWIPKSTHYTPGSKGSLTSNTKTSILKTEADIQRLFSTTLGGTLGSTVTRLIGAVLPFSLSGSYGKLKQEKEINKSVYAFTKADYVHYGLSLDWGSPRALHLNSAFRQAVSQLPLAATTYAYLDFIDHFGTHLSTEVQFGGLVHHRLQLTQSTYAAVVKKGIDVAGEAQKVFQAKYANNSEKSTYREVSESSESIDFCGGTAQDNILDWFGTIKQDPAPIHLNLRPLHELLDNTFFPNDDQIARKRSLLAAATKTYLEKNSQTMEWEPWPSVSAGGNGGSFFSDIDCAPNLRETNQKNYQNARVREVRVWIKNWIEAVQMVLESEALEGEQPQLSAHGSDDGTLHTLRLAPDDYIASVEVMSASPQKIIFDRGGPYVGSLRITTRKGEKWVVGTPGDNPIALDIPENYQAIGFHGRLGKYIDRLGVISIPVPTARLIS